MPDSARVTWSVAVEFVAIHNVDLFRRGHYKVHLSFLAPENGGVELTVSPDTVTKIEGRHPACVSEDGKTVTSSSVLILYRQQRNILADNFHGLVHCSVPIKKLSAVSDWAPVRCSLELHHAPNDTQTTDAPPSSAFTKVSRHRLYLHLSPQRHSLHAHRSLLFDFCHLAGVQIRVHAVLSSIVLEGSEPTISEKSRSSFRSAVRGFLAPSDSSSKPRLKSGRSSRSHSFRVGDRPRKSRRNTEGDATAMFLQTLKVRGSTSQGSHRYRVDNISFEEAATICRLLLTSKVALVQTHQLLLGKSPPVLPDIDELIDRMFQKGRRSAVPYGDALDYVSAISGEIAALWDCFLTDLSEMPSASQRLLYRCQHQRSLRWREGILTQAQPIANCLAMAVEHLPSLDCAQLQSFAEKITTDLYGRLAFQPLSLACKVADGTHRNMPLILEQIFSGECSTTEVKRTLEVPSSQTLVGEEEEEGYDGEEESDTEEPELSNGSSAALMTLSEFLSAIPSSESVDSIDTTNGAPEMLSLREFLSSGLAKKRESEVSANSLGSTSADSSDMLSLDEFLSIVASNIPGTSSTAEGEEDSGSPGITLEDFLCQVSPKCSQAVICRGSQASGGSGFDTPREQFSVEELLSLFATERLVRRSTCDSMTLANFLGSTPERPDEQLPVDKPCDEMEPPSKEPYNDSEAMDAVDLLGVPAVRPAISSHQLLVGEAKDLIRNDLPSSWRFLSDSPCNFLPAPYFSSVEGYHSSSRPVHLVVCVHGLEGLHLDLRMFSVYLKLALPGASLTFLKSKRNEQNTNNDFHLMIEALVAEIIEFIKEKELDVEHLSFVGHSLGNIIIRGALAHPAMSDFLPLLRVYISFAGPHLGTVHANSVVSTGMWLLRKWKKSTSLCQLAMKDHADKRQSFLYQLSLKPGLALFQSVLLVASHQDQYVPFHSAHIARHPGGDDEELSRVHTEMVQNLLRPLQYTSTQLSRYTVVYHFQSSVDVNVLVGRAGHVAVLDNDLFLEKFVALFCVPKFAMIAADPEETICSAPACSS